MKIQRAFVKLGQRYVVYDAIVFDVAEHCDFVKHGARQLGVGARDDDIRVNTEALKLVNGVLSRLAFVFVAAGNVRHQTDVHEQAIFSSDLIGKLADCLDERLPLDVADGAADFGYYDVRRRGLGGFQNEILYFARYMRNDLHGFSEVLAPSLLGENVPEHSAAGEVGIFREVFVDEPFVMAEIEVGLQPVFGYENFAVLDRIHRARIDVHIRIELLRSDFETSALQESAEACRHDTFSEARHDASGNENKFAHFVLRLPLLGVIFQKKGVFFRVNQNNPKEKRFLIFDFSKNSNYDTTEKRGCQRFEKNFFTFGRKIFISEFCAATSANVVDSRRLLG